MAYCLPPQLANKIKKAIRSGELNPAKLNDMTSRERRDFLAGVIGAENAKEVNLLFEKKLLLVNQERAMYDWAKQITGMSKEQKEATLQKIRDTYAEKKRKVFSPKENEQFLSEIVGDVYSKKFKTEISIEEAQKIIELTQDMKNAKDKMNEDLTWETKEDGINFGATKVAIDNYVSDLKLRANKESIVNPLKASGLGDKAGAVINNIKISLNFIADNSRALKASVDNSLWGRQGIKVLFTKPTIWAKNFVKSFSDIWIVLRKGNIGGDAVIDAVKAEVYSRKNYLNGRYELGKRLDIGTGEEEFPTSAPSKIPVLGRLFRAAEVSFEAGAMRMRTDIADKIYNLAEQQEVDMEDKFEIGSINQVVNSMTGRGSLGRFEPAAKAINKFFFSIKFFKSNLDTLTLHAGSNISRFARKQAAINLLKMTSSMAIILAIASMFGRKFVEWDPRSSNFGKIKIGNTRFDVTGGMSSIIILAARIVTQSTKSSTTGLMTKFNEGYGSPTGMDVVWNFTENKFSPMFSVVKELVEQETFEGAKPTVLNELVNLTVPIVIETGFDAAQRDTMANTILALIADGLGVSANTYVYNVNWESNLGKELKQFKEKIGAKEFKNANKKYNKRVNEKIQELQRDEEWLKLDNEDKKNQLSSEKADIKQDIFKEYRFKYKKKK